ncbi:MAG: rRNA maturation RNase YbeY [Campylobacterota bacterium]|nr:rRNA maturation RNase YbeY [Campylobacterota bacterium]
MIELDNRTSHDVDLDSLEKIADTLTEEMIELIITDDKEIQRYNKEFRQIDKATDVLSFPYEPMPMSPLGSIIISYEHAMTVSKRLGHSPDDEMALLFIHGILHLLGYDHEVDSGEMRQRERELIEQFSLPVSLIVRTEGS